MSAGAHTVTVAPSFERSTPADNSELSDATRRLIRVTSFGALALYGVIRWGTLVSPTPTWRLVGLVVLAVVLAASAPPLRTFGLWAPIMVAVGICLLAFPVAGLQWHSFVHLRIAVSARHIGNGLEALPNALVPYSGTSHEVRLVIALGAAILLLDSALVLAFAPAAFGDARRAGAALPLIALAVVPATLVRPEFPYLQGLVLFALLALFMWGERIRREAFGPALAFAALAGIVAALAAPRLDQHKPLLNYRAWTGTVAHFRVDSFDWNQTYGPLHWPHSGHQVMTVRAKSGDYWKAENLDVFNGTDWVTETTGSEPALPPPSAASVARWTQSIRVTITGMSTTDVIAPGQAVQPNDVPGGVLEGADPGLWVADRELGPGTSYQVTSYSPHPSAAQLSHAGMHYPWTALSEDLSLTVPGADLFASEYPTARFGPFHAPTKTFGPFDAPSRTRLSQGGVPVPGPSIGTLMAASPYAAAYVLAQHLAAESKTPYAFVANVLRYLSHGYTYNQNPALTDYPLATFLFKDKKGYCQQFSGSMALLLRMGGVPARVAAGFTAGNLNRTTGQWDVTDIDAHAWVEVWFPHYGWVRFDPTPTVAPARGGQTSPGLAKILPGGSGALPTPISHGNGSSSTLSVSNRHGSGSSMTPLLIVPVLAILVALGLLARTLLRPAPDTDDLLAELERALARTRRPLQAQTTLAALEHRFRDSAAAADYIRSLRLIRYGSGEHAPTTHGRRALRAQLRDGLGLSGRLRALWALPPRLPLHLRRRAGH
jgi:protein-glutamine gamma-glutamyltransferase